MKFKEVSAIPKTEYRNHRNDVVNSLKEFMKMNIKCAQLSFTKLEFECSCTAHSAFMHVCRTRGLPVKVYIRNSTVYLERTDI